MQRRPTNKKAPVVRGLAMLSLRLAGEMHLHLLLLVHAGFDFPDDVARNLHAGSRSMTSWATSFWR
jgi:hypothetical protein